MFDYIAPEWRNAGPGIAGSMLALVFLRRPPLILFGILIGGCILSFYGTPWVAAYFDMEKYRDLVSFLVGLFGMAFVTKIYDTLEVAVPKDIWTAILDAIRKKLGA